MSIELAAAPIQPLPAAVRIGDRGLVLNDLEALWRFSGYVTASGLAPKGISTREAIFVAVQMGLEVGLTPMAALQNIAVINGRPSIWGDAQLAIVRGTGQLESFDEWFEQGGKRLVRNPTSFPDDTVAVCRVKRAGYPAAETGFSVLDAKAAGLWGKEGPWKQYPYRMLKFRSRSFGLRDQFGDALKGILSAEEVNDLPIKEANVTEVKAPKFLTERKSEEPVAATPTEAAAETPAPADPAPVRQSRRQQREAATPPASSEPDPNPRDALWAYLDSKKCQVWSDFIQWLETYNHVKADSLVHYDHLPLDLCSKLMANDAALLAPYVKTFGVKGEK